MSSTANSYNETPYESHAVSNTQPDRLATLATLFGLDVMPPSRARVLEIGCAAGGNLIPLAFRYPDAKFVGIDLSERQIEEGQRDAAALGLRNLEFAKKDLMDVDAALGSFDYIIAHGIYSWIPARQREKLLAICSANLSDIGVAYVSYNTLPGWRMRGAIREMMRYHVSQFTESAQRAEQARALVGFLGAALAENTSAYAMMLREEMQVLGVFPDYHLLHEYLEDVNEPLYFHQFFECASRAGLQYLCDEEIATSVPDLLFKPEVLSTLQRISPDFVRSEQYSDFLCNRGFRRSLLVGAARSPERAFRSNRVIGLLADSHAQPGDGQVDIHSSAPAHFAGEAGGMLATSSSITKAAFAVLHSYWPEAIAFDQLYARACAALGRADTMGAAMTNPEFAMLVNDFLRAFLAGVAGLHCAPSGARNDVSECPVAFAPARYYAGRGRRKLPNARHNVVTLDDFLADLLPLLDGTRSRAALVDQLTGRLTRGNPETQQSGAILGDPEKARKFATDELPGALARLRELAFLVG